MNKHEFDIDPSKPVKEVRTKTRLIGGLFYIKGIEIISSTDECLMLFETSTEKGGQWTVQNVEPGERVIGYHGQIGTSFGIKIW